MPSSLHRCPQCKMVGKVNRSKTRSIGEKLRLRMIPVYGVYRCHNCNWRGWLLRSNATPAISYLLLTTYIVVTASVLAAVVYFLVTHWPSAHYRY